MLINFVVLDRDTKPMVCLSCVSGSWCCTLKKHYVVLSSNSHIPPPNFKLQSQCIWFVVNICGIDLTWQLGFNSGGLSDSTKY